MLTLGYVSGQLVQEPFCSSLMWALMRELREPGRRAITEVMRSRGLYIDENRAGLVEGFLKGENEYLMMVDTDVEFHRELPLEMLEVMRAQPTIGVLGLDLPLTLGMHSGFIFNNKTGQWQGCTEVVGGPLIEVDAVAFGAVMFRRKTLTDAGAPGINIFERWWNGRKVGEDFAACARIRESGGRVVLYQSPTVTLHWHSQPLAMPEKGES